MEQHIRNMGANIVINTKNCLRNELRQAKKNVDKIALKGSETMGALQTIINESTECIKRNKGFIIEQIKRTGCIFAVSMIS